MFTSFCTFFFFFLVFNSKFSDSGLYNTVFGDNEQILSDEQFYKLLGSYYIMEYIKLKIPKYKMDENKLKEIK